MLSQCLIYPQRDARSRSSREGSEILAFSSFFPLRHVLSVNCFTQQLKLHHGINFVGNLNRIKQIKRKLRHAEKCLKQCSCQSTATAIVLPTVTRKDMYSLSSAVQRHAVDFGTMAGSCYSFCHRSLYCFLLLEKSF